MLNIYRSNKIDILLLKMCDIIKKKPLDNIFEREILIHDNRVLLQYINIFIAHRKGISGNFKFYHPINFIWKLFKIIAPFNEIKNIFTPSIMTFKIMKIIDENIICENINKKDQIIKKFKFSFLMANIFEQYLIYRPDWINMWENKEKVKIIHSNQEWQMKLWRKLINDDKKNHQPYFHFSNLFSYLKLLMSTRNIKKKIFQTVFLFFHLFH